MHNPFISDEHRRHLEQRSIWEQSLTQDTYTVMEAAKVMKRGKDTIYLLIEEGKLHAVKHGELHSSERGTVIPKWAIVN